MNLLALNWNDLTNPYGGGAEVHLEELLRRLVKMGHRVTLFCSGWRGCRAEEEIEGVRIIRRGMRYTFNFVAPIHLRRLVRREQFDVMIENINKVPFYTPWYLNVPTLVLINHLFSTTVFHETNFLLGSYVYLLEQPLPRVYRGKQFNVVSESTRDDLMARGIPASDISLTYSGIDRTTYYPDESVSKYEIPTLLYLGRIRKYKSIQHIIRALALVRRRVPNARLMVVGAGNYLETLKTLARQLNLADAVEFPGFVSREEKVERMRRAHAIVLPSPREGWGLTNTEANGVGTPAIAADAPGLRDSVKNGQSGFLYEYGNIEQLSDRLVEVLTDEAVRHRLERGALAWADRFNWDEAARQFSSYLEAVKGQAV